MNRPALTYYHPLFFLIVSLTICNSVFSKEENLTTTHRQFEYIEFPFLEKKSLHMRFYVDSMDALSEKIDQCIVKISRADDPSEMITLSSRFVQVSNAHVDIVSISRLQVDKSRTTEKSGLSELIARLGILPPGHYKVDIQLLSGSEIILMASNSWLIESDMEKYSLLYNIVNNGVRVNPKTNIVTGVSERNLNKSLAKISSGLHCLVSEEERGFRVRILYGEEELMVRTTFIEKKSREITDNSIPDLNDYFSPFQLNSNIQRLRTMDNEKKTIEGNVQLTQSFNSEIDTFTSGQRSITELYGNIDIPLMGIPLSLSGFYTTMDKGRQVRSSYFRVHFNKEKLRQQLLEEKDVFIKNYHSAFSSYKNTAFSNNHYLTDLNHRKDSLQTVISGEYGEKGSVFLSMVTSLADRDGITDSLKSMVRNYCEESIRSRYTDMDSLGIEARVDEYYTKVISNIEKYHQVRSELDDYIQVYRQFSQKIKLDSLITSNNFNSLRNSSELNNRDLYDNLKHVLPDNKLTGILSTISHLDMGIINKQVSRYTMDGQVLKGGSVGFDFHNMFSQFTYGKVEYVDRNSNIEEYNTFNSRLGYRFGDAHSEVAFVFQNITGASSLLSSYSFQNLHKEQVLESILGQNRLYSLTSSGKLNKFLSWDVDYTLSDSKVSDTDKSTNNIFSRSAVNMELSGSIPKKDIFLSINYENVGRGFENNTLSFVMNGIERVSANAEGYFLNSKIYLGLQYNYILQKNLYSEGRQNKFGIDVKTQFRNLPNVSFSYKPFTAIRSPYDTFSIVQRQILGSVMLLNVNYIYKTKTDLLRFVLMQNTSQSLHDSERLSTRTLQLMVFYSRANKVTGNLIIGTFRNESDAEYLHQYNAYNKNRFVNAGLSYRFNKNIMLTAGSDFSFNSNTVLRRGGQAGIVYSFDKVPLTVRVNNRLYSYRLYEMSGMTNIYMMSLDIGYRFIHNMK